jgi:hypothetical protein
MRVRVLVALAGLLAATAVRADVSFDVEATVGAQRLGVTRAPGTNEALLPMGELGATLLLRGGPFAAGVAAEGNFGRVGMPERYNASGLAGFATDLLPMVRLELLGELGAADLRSKTDAREAARGDGAWQRFYGFRPGLSARLPILPLRVGVWGLARWGLPGTGSGPSYGLLGRIGLTF